MVKTVLKTQQKSHNPKVYFTSDPHFGHDNLNAKLRKLTTEDADALIIKNWNKTVLYANDKVYIVGDLTMEKHNFIEKYISQLNGEIIFIGGNHDNRKCCKKLQELGITVMGCLEYKGYIVTHIPVRYEQAKEFRGNIHGHIHSYEIPSYRYINITADLNDYTPQTLDYIINKQRNKKSIKSYLYLTYKIWELKLKRLKNKLRNKIKLV